MAGIPAASIDSSRLEAEILEVGRSLADEPPGSLAHPLRTVDERMMQMAAHDRELRAALFRLVDVTPACRDLDDLGRHLAGFLSEVDEQPRSLAAAMRVSHTKAGRVALGMASAAGVRHMAHRFIAGAEPNAAAGELRRIWETGIASTVDLLGEATVTAAEADRYRPAAPTRSSSSRPNQRDWPATARLEARLAGPLPRANLSVKVSALTPLLRPEAPERAVADAAVRLRPLLRARAGARRPPPHRHGVARFARDDPVADPRRCSTRTSSAMAPRPASSSRRTCASRQHQLDRILDWAGRSRRAPPLTIRLVKGAYWDHEVAEARQHGWSGPGLHRQGRVRPQLRGAHRAPARRAPAVRVALALPQPALARARGRLRNRARRLDDRDLELQVLRGLGDDLADVARPAGMRVRVYCPVGDLVAGMAYLVRRLLENTSNESFLPAQPSGAPLEELLAAP